MQGEKARSLEQPNWSCQRDLRGNENLRRLIQHGRASAAYLRQGGEQAQQFRDKLLADEAQRETANMAGACNPWADASLNDLWQRTANSYARMRDSEQVCTSPQCHCHENRLPR